MKRLVDSQNTDPKQQPHIQSKKLAETSEPKKPVSRILAALSKWLAGYESFSRDRKEAVLNGLIESSNPDIDYFILVFLSCTIATFGLITNSAAVIIGAMLIAPLMSPILSLAMSSISGLSNLFKQSIIAILEGFGLAVALSSLLAFLTYKLPFGALVTISSEVAARTRPSLIDLLIGLAGGAAAAYALAHPQLSAALPGVAISTALMPPICTIGIGIALAHPAIIFGALLLFITNLTAITFSAMITFAIMGFGPRLESDSEKITQSVSITLILVLAISIPLGLFAFNSFNEAQIFNLTSNAIVENVSTYTDVSLVELNITNEGGVRKIEAVLRTSRELNLDEVSRLQSYIADRLQKPVALELVTIPMRILDPLNPPTPTPTVTSTPYLSATPTITPTLTLMPTATQIPTATPLPAFVVPSNGINVYDAPGGNVVFRLPKNAAVRVIAQTLKIIEKVKWVEVKDSFGRTGWINASGLDIQLESHSQH